MTSNDSPEDLLGFYCSRCGGSRCGASHPLVHLALAPCISTSSPESCIIKLNHCWNQFVNTVMYDTWATEA